MKYKQFEKHIKSELYHATEDFDMEALINAITTPDNKKKRWFWFFIPIGFLLFVAVFGWYSLKNDKSINIQAKNTSLHSSNSISDNEKINHQTKNSNFDDKQTIQLTNNKISTQKKKTKRKRKLNSRKRTIHSNKTYAINNAINSTALSATSFKQKNKRAFLSNSSLKTQISKKSIPSLLQKIPFLPQKTTTLPNIDTEDCPSFGKRHWVFRISGEVGIIKPFKQLEFDGTNPPEVFNLRKNNEKTLEGLQAAFYTQISKERLPVYLCTGVSYTQITEQLKMNFSNTEIDTTRGIISYSQSENGDTLTIIWGDIITETTIEKKTVSHHYFKLLDIPIGIGYTFYLRKFRIGMEAGALLNIKLNTTGLFLRNVDTITDINRAVAFKPNIGVSYYGGITLSKYISGRSSIYLSTRFRYFPNNFASRTNEIIQKYNFAGLHAGYSFEF